MATKYGASVKARHSSEYPQRRDPSRTRNELRELALGNLRLMNLVRSTVGMTPRPELVPTKEKIAAFDDG